MSVITNFLRTDTSLLIIIFIIFLLSIGFLIILYKVLKLNKKYNKFIKKIGNSENIEEDLETYMYRVEKIEKQNLEILNYISKLDKDIRKCIQKVGIVRYNAFKDTGSNLSFALALLDDENNGIVLNGIYSRDMSNIYAKPVENGKSSYAMSEEEKNAIQKAIESENIIRI